ncbi:MAG: hypothetical protein JSW52_01010 [Candidatus Coatesbacteria bacterium]|nr:MAG: hypothetical protein JSW52_01010 [Candidatus Coatesbacteria bacterium]
MENIRVKGLLRVALGAVVIIGTLAVNGCIFGTDPPIEDPPAEGFGSPAGVIELIQDAYTERNIDLYKECLSPDFTFYFDQNDVGDDVEGYVIPVSWNYDDEVEAVNNMFDEAHSIDITLTNENISDPEPDDTVFNVPSVQISLLVMVDATNGFLATGFVEFDFESYLDPKDQTEKLWRVKNWRDYTAPS